MCPSTEQTPTSPGALAYAVPGISCGHCEVAITGTVGDVAGVDSVDVDLATKVVTVRGTDVDDDSVRAAIDDAGYEATQP